MREDGLRVWSFGLGRSRCGAAWILGAGGQGVKGQDDRQDYEQHTSHGQMLREQTSHTGAETNLGAACGDLGLCQRGGWRMSRGHRGSN